MIRLFKIYLTLAFLLVTTFCMAQKSELKFSKDGKFKIVQFTDVHFKYGSRYADLCRRKRCEEGFRWEYHRPGEAVCIRYPSAGI